MNATQLPITAQRALAAAIAKQQPKAFAERALQIAPTDKRPVLQGLINKGTSAFADLATRRPDVVRRLVEDATRRGWRPTDLFLSFHNGGRRAVKQVAAQQYSEGTSQGQFDSWAWDDGDNATWEGSVVYEDYTTGEYSIMNAYLYVGNYDWYSIDTEVVDWGPQGGAIKFRPLVDKQPQVLKASFRIMNSAAQPSVGFQRCMNNCARNKLTDWAWSAGAWCATAGGMCLFSGPLYFACAGIGCSFAVLATAIDRGLTKLEMDCAVVCR